MSSNLVKRIISTLILVTSVLAGLIVFVFLTPKKVNLEITPTPNPGQNISDMVNVEYPGSDQPVKSPLLVTGRARGYWFFEASFPIRLYDDNGIELAVGIAQAQPDPVTGEINWMTENYVPFEAVLTFAKPVTQRGRLVLEKDNPSGLPENDAQFSVPVFFDLDDITGLGLAGCKIGGCSGQLCLNESDEDVLTTCEYRAEYACYKNAKCERQDNGMCGWTPTEELVSCLSAAFQSEPQ